MGVRGFISYCIAVLVFVSSAVLAEGFDRDRLVIETETGPHAFEVELAQTEQERARGLMYREALGEGTGMLFDYGYPRQVSMWMKNTLIPLDMLFIRANGTIEKIAERTTPHSLDPISSLGDVRAVLEISGGVSEKLGIKAGDRVIHSIFGTAE